MIIDSITFSPNCKKITVVISDCPNSATITYENKISNKTYITPSPLPPSDDDIIIWEEYVTTLESGNSAINGVIAITIADSTAAVVSGASVSSCELYCCIAKLVESGISCTCNCSKCDDDIRTAEKIHLLVKSAESAATQGTVTDAIDKYTKAKSFCDNTCGCGC
jgi:hypothetical protein